MNFPIRKYYKGHVDNGLLLSFKTIRCLFFNLNIFLTAKNKTETKNEISQFLYHHHYYYILFWAIWSQQSLGKYLLLCLSLCLHYLKKKYIYISIYIIQGLPSEKAMAPHSSTLAWKIPQTEESGRLQSMGSLRVGHE